MRKEFKIALITILVVLILDQTLKIWVKTHMLLGEDSYEHWGWSVSWFRLHFIENPGMAFGWMLPGKWGKLALSLFRIILVVVLSYYMIKVIKSNRATWHFTFFLSLILAGAIGNLIDSAFYGLIFTESPSVYSTGEPAKFVAIGEGYAGFLQGRVVDMLFFPLCQCHFPDWIPVIGGRSFLFFNPVFNIADSAVTVGTFGIILFKNKIEKKINDESDSQPDERLVSDTAGNI